jgi:hypothetical protein
MFSIRSSLIALLVGAAACGDDGDDSVSEGRIDAAIAAYCENAVPCGIDTSQDHCEWYRRTLFDVHYGSESEACRAAELDEYECYANLATCDDFDNGCEAAEEATSDACQP